MLVIKSLNNNVVLCLDSNGNEVVAFAKGAGFRKPPYELPVSEVQRTYYDVDKTYINMINDIPEDIMGISADIVKKAQEIISDPLSPNILFTLADHINFAILRQREGMVVSLPLIYDIRHIYPNEVSLGKLALELLKNKVGVVLPQEEAFYVALHIINAESLSEKTSPAKQDKKIIDDITAIIEDYFHFSIDRDTFNYARFATHMHYLIGRCLNKEMLSSANSKLFELISPIYEQTNECVTKISDYLSENLNCEIPEEEVGYITLHVNRLCSQENFPKKQSELGGK